jgi:GTP diphosphokinase / guanosine-3',5'-bis(diphosphate) 3'-diphosphatase
MDVRTRDKRQVLTESLDALDLLRNNLSYLSLIEKKRIDTACAMAEKHLTPQSFQHNLCVAQELTKFHADAETIIASILMRSIKKGQLPLATSQKVFPRGISPLMNNLISSPPSGKHLSIESLRKVFQLMKQDIRSLVIILVDRLCTMRKADEIGGNERLLIAQETLDVFANIADKVCMQKLRNELETLCFSVLDPKFFDEMSLARSTHEKNTLEEILPKIQNTFKSIEPSLNVTFQIEKPKINNVDTSCHTISLICDDVGSCYRAFGVLHQAWLQQSHSFRDFINAPRINGYQGLHTEIILGDGSRVLCKIRTQTMQEYAERGIACMGFDHDAIGLLEYLPWLERISLLLEDTASTPQDFWEHLKSDVWGEHIRIHGENGNFVLIPDRATALDGALECFHEKTFTATAILVNGESVPFDTKLSNGASIKIERRKRRTVKRKWLQYVRMRTSALIIRSTLGKSSEAKKIALGRHFLQEVMYKKHRGFLEEFSEIGFVKYLKPIGYSSLNEACSAIASGNVEPLEVYKAIFETKESKRISNHNVISKIACRLGVAFLVAAWGLDPVFAKMLLTEPFAVSPVDFTIVRFSAFFVLCFASSFILQKRQRLPLKKTSLERWISLGRGAFSNYYCTYDICLSYCTSSARVHCNDIFLCAPNTNFTPAYTH